MRCSAGLSLFMLMAACSDAVLPVVERDPCPDERVRCGTGCVDVLLDDRNCGGCGTVCEPGSGLACFAGGCTVPSPLLQPRTRHAAVVLNGLIYVIGGDEALPLGPGTYIQSVEAYDPRTNRWARVDELKHPRAMLGAGVIGGEIFAFGGYGPPGVITAFVESFYADSWSDRFEELPSPRGFAAYATTSDERLLGLLGVSSTPSLLPSMAVLGSANGKWQTVEVGGNVSPRWSPCAVRSAAGRIHVLGGTTDVQLDGWPHPPPYDVVSDAVDVYDPGTETWEPGPPMLQGAAVAACALGEDGRIYHMGGAGAGPQSVVVDIVQAYDPSDREWQPVKPLPDVRVAPAAVAHPDDGRIYVIGGEAYATPKDTVFAYDPKRDEWFP